MSKPNEPLDRSNEGNIEIITGSIKNKNNFFTKKKAAILILLVAISSIFLAIFIYTRNSDNSKNQNESTQQKIEDAYELLKVGNIDEAEEILNSSKSIQDNREALPVSVSVKMNKKDYQGCIDLILSDIEEYGVEAKFYSTLGICYENIGNKVEAAKYYQLHIDYIKTLDEYPLQQSDIDSYSRKVKLL